MTDAWHRFNIVYAFYVFQRNPSVSPATRDKYHRTRSPETENKRMKKEEKTEVSEKKGQLNAAAIR